MTHEATDQDLHNRVIKSSTTQVIAGWLIILRHPISTPRALALLALESKPKDQAK